MFGCRMRPPPGRWHSGGFFLTVQIVLPPTLDPALMAFAAQWQNKHRYDVRPAR